MDLIPNIEFRQYFNFPKRISILHKLEENQMDSVVTLLYMFTRAPPKIYQFFYTTLELTKIELHTLKFIVENIEKEALKMRTTILKNSRILSKLNEITEERNSYKIQRIPFTKYNIGYRLNACKKLQGEVQEILKNQQEITMQTGIGPYTLAQWVKAAPFYRKMIKKYPGIKYLGKFGDWDRIRAEEGEIMLNKGYIESSKIFPKLTPTKMGNRLLFYIKCAGLQFGSKVQGALTNLKNKIHKGTRSKTILTALLRFENYYRKWISKGGVVVTVEDNNMDSIDNIDNKDIIIDNKDIEITDTNNINIEEPNFNQINKNKWEIREQHWLRPPIVHNGGIPKVSNISHRFHKTPLPPTNHIGKTKYDGIEEKWGCVILHKYLILKPAEIACVLRIKTLAVWHAIELYECYGPRGLVENIWREEMGEKYREIYGAHVKTYAERAERQGQPISLHATVAHLRAILPNKSINPLLISDIFKKLGFSYCQARVSYKEKHKVRVIDMRGEYIKNIYRYRETGELKEIYVDESFVRDFKEKRNFWMRGGNKTRSVPISSIYNQIAIVGALASDGWVGVDYSILQSTLVNSNSNYQFSYGGILYFKTLNPDRSDPHTCFTRESFGSYFREHLLPSLNDSSVIIMDRAAYHTPLADTQFNIKKARKSELIEFLICRGVNIIPHSSSKSLRILAEKITPEGKSYLEVEAEREGHKLLYTPPYHPELNPIELAWSMVKRPISDTDNPSANYICEDILPRSFGLVTPHIAAKLFAHVEGELLRFKGGHVDLIDNIDHTDNHLDHTDNHLDHTKIENNTSTQNTTISN